MDRVRSGIPALDDVLGGGFPASSINIVAGGPGTGKTMLMQQIVYANATPERKVLYLTTVSEPMHKVLRYVQQYPFFDAAKVGDVVQYADIGALLHKSDVKDVMKYIETLVTREGPAFLVIDSFKALSELAPDVPTFRRALYRLAGVLTASGTTAFLVGEYAPKEVGLQPEFAVADGIVELTNERRGIRTYRYLNVVKLRGSNFVDGRHAVRLTSEGVQVFPRFRTPEAPARYVKPSERTSLGVPDFDRLVGDGVLRGSNTLVAGPTGSGKTLLAMSFAFNAVKRGERAVFASFQEDPSQLEWLAKQFGWDVSSKDGDAHLRTLYVSPVELDLDEHFLRIVEAIKEVDAQFVVIDSLTDLEAGAYDVDRFMNYVYSLVQYFKDAGLTTLMTYESNKGLMGGEATAKGVSRIADNVIVFHNNLDGQRVSREVRVVKTRGSRHDLDRHPFDIDAAGFRFLNGGGK